MNEETGNIRQIERKVVGYRGVQARRIARAYDDVLDGQDPKQVLHNLLTESLAPYHKKAYELISAQSKQNLGVPAHDVAMWLEVKINHASTILHELWTLGLLTREELRDEQGRSFIYSDARQDKEVQA